MTCGESRETYEYEPNGQERPAIAGDSPVGEKIRMSSCVIPK